MNKYFIAIGAIVIAPTVMASDLKDDPETLRAQLRQEQDKTEQVKQTQQLKQKIADQQQEQQELQSGERQATDSPDDSDKSKFVQGRNKVEKEADRVIEQIKGAF